MEIRARPTHTAKETDGTKANRERWHDYKNREEEAW
jgi:hypothetical protein